jgi:Integrase core domain
MPVYLGSRFELLPRKDIQPGRPMQNNRVESFARRFRDE